MLFYGVEGVPVAWAAPQRCGNIYFNPKHKEKQHIIWQLKGQVSHAPLSCPIYLSVLFIMPIPKSTSKMRRQQMIHGAICPIGKPDRSNMLKMIEDCLQDAGIITNDSIIVDGPTKKIYGEEPKTLIRIKTITEWQQELHDDPIGDFEGPNPPKTTKKSEQLPLFPTKTSQNLIKRLKGKHDNRRN